MDRFSEGVAAVACGSLILLLSIILMQVFLRYVFLYPLAWPDEFARALHVWVVFPGAYLALRRGEHVRVDYFASFIPRRWQVALDVFIGGACFVFLCILIYSGLKGLVKLWAAKSPAMGLPLPFLLIATLLGAFLMAAYYGAWIYRNVRGVAHDWDK